MPNNNGEEDEMGMLFAFFFIFFSCYIPESGENPPEENIYHWCVDGDGDGLGDPEDCDGDGFLGDEEFTLVADCDDFDASVNPDAAEVCDGKDNDCDGEVDDDAAGALVWFADADLDGYGDAPFWVRSCYQPYGYSPAYGDCDDRDAAVYPGAAEYNDPQNLDSMVR